MCFKLAGKDYTHGRKYFIMQNSRVRSYKAQGISFTLIWNENLLPPNEHHIHISIAKKRVCLYHCHKISLILICEIFSMDAHFHFRTEKKHL